MTEKEPGQDVIEGVLWLILAGILIAALVWWFNNTSERDEACRERGGHYKVFEGRCVINLNEIEIPI